MTLSNLRIALAIACTALSSVGSAARAQQSQTWPTDAQFTIYANSVAATFPCQEARKKVKDSAQRLMYNVCKERWKKRHGIMHGTATENGKTHPSTMIVDEDSDVIPIDSASIVFVNREWITKDNCR